MWFRQCELPLRNHHLPCGGWDCCTPCKTCCTLCAYSTPHQRYIKFLVAWQQGTHRRWLLTSNNSNNGNFWNFMQYQSLTINGESPKPRNFLFFFSFWSMTPLPPRHRCERTSRSNQDDLHSSFHVADVGQKILSKPDLGLGDAGRRLESFFLARTCCFDGSLM